jgi:hypothetical protein
MSFDLQKILAAYKAATTLTPIVREAMQLAQALVPEKGQGSARLAIVQAHVKAAIEDLKVVEAKFEEVWPVINRGIPLAVEALKATGVLTSGAPAVLAAVEAVNTGVALFKSATAVGSAGAQAAP